MIPKERVKLWQAFSGKIMVELAHVSIRRNFYRIWVYSVVQALLEMVLNGADGGTYEAMKEALALSGLTEEQINQNYRSLIDLLRRVDPAVIFQIANSVWCDQGFPVKDEFIAVNQQYFDAEVDTLDFGSQQAIDTINNWVNEETNGLIEDIIDEIDSDVVMYLINAIYFNGGWADKFDKENTQERSFYLADGSTSTCQMMREDIDMGYYDAYNIHVIDLPYGNGRYSMTIFLPKKGGGPIEGLPESMQQEEEETWWDIDELAANFAPQNYDRWISRLSPEKDETLLMPKFKLEYELVLNNALAEMGMGVAFGGGANFSRMTDIANPELWIGEVKHKTYIEVDEEGTRAAAVTVGPMEMGISLPLVIDHPFLFTIREHESNTILFMGKIMEPVWEE